MRRHALMPTETAAIRGLVDQLTTRFPGPEDAEFLRAVGLDAHELPRTLRQALCDFKLEEPVGGLLLVSGWPVDDGHLGPTPSHWKVAGESRRTFAHEAAMLLVGSLLGDPVGWATQQDGRLVHHVLPIREHEHAQLGSGSLELLWWHNEDAFHPLRPDYVILMCLRNPDRVATTYGSLADVKLSPPQIDKLFEPHFTIKPDNSHQPDARGDNEYASDGYDAIARMNQAPDKISVFYGDRSSPYLRLDPYFMDRVADPAAQDALDTLVREMDRTLLDLVLEPGDICILDNHRAVHGRRPFQARFDGTDRWLERILISRDLKRSRANRASSTDRILF